jgi:hypothetical protein
MIGYVSRKEFANSIGLKDSTVRGWQERHWQRGIHYVVIGKTTLLIKDEIEKWLNSQRDSANKVAGLKSEPRLTAKSITKPSKEISPKITSPLA